MFLSYVRLGKILYTLLSQSPALCDLRQMRNHCFSPARFIHSATDTKLAVTSVGEEAIAVLLPLEAELLLYFTCVRGCTG